jgi:hypothetical protein
MCGGVSFGEEDMMSLELPVGEYLTYYTTPPYNTSREHYFEFRPFFKEIAEKYPKSTGVEVGVFEGFNSLGACRFCDPKKIYLVDPYKQYNEVIEGTLTSYTQEDWDNIYEWAQQRLIGMPVEFIRKTSLDASKDFADESLDYVYIDGDHSVEAVSEDIDSWHRKVKNGGIIGGHDAIELEVQQALAGWLYKHQEYSNFFHFKWNDWWIIKK